jgi:hypothetical protein
MTKHLTEPNPDLAEQVKRTPQGMAHWAGSGPEGATCGGCSHYGYWYTTWTNKKRRKPSGCELYYRRMHTHPDSPLPKATAACKYFEPKPPSPAEKQP